MNNRYFRINEPDASTEDFQTEILAVNLKNGHYHSIRGTAVPIWRLLMAGHNVQSVSNLFASKYGVELSKAQNTVESLVKELETADLIVPGTAPESPAEDSPAWLATFSGEFSEPLLESYTDMQDLLLLDPIHDVDAEGWPKVPGPDSKD
jgi:hypothetical protein